MGCVLALIRTDLTAYNRYRVRINVILLCHVCFFVGPRCWFVRCVNLYINIRRAHANTTKASLFTPSLIFAQLSLEIKLLKSKGIFETLHFCIFLHFAGSCETNLRFVSQAWGLRTPLEIGGVRTPTTPIWGVVRTVQVCETNARSLFENRSVIDFQKRDGSQSRSLLHICPSLI